jgi:hypothetical protein
MCVSFESRFNRCDESEVNAARLRPHARACVNLGKPGKYGSFCDSDEPAVTVSRNGALTINCGRVDPRCRAGTNRRVGKANRPHAPRSERIIGSCMGTALGAFAQRHALQAQRYNERVVSMAPQQ